MLSLTYLSSATSLLDDADLADLLTEIRPKNEAAGVTGMLLYADGNFIQTLEGPEDAVRSTFERIQRDDRHRGVMVALDDEVDRRSYPDWSMGFRTLDREQAAALPGYSDFLDVKHDLEDGATVRGRADVFHRVFRESLR